MCTAALRVGLNLIEGQRKILGSRGEHAPHVTHILAPQLTKYRITEQHVIGVTRRHRLRVKLLKGLVEAGNQRVVGLAHGRVRAGLESEHDNLQ
ncbi:hypothetical protein Pfra02_13660 [Pseudomonas fragi]|nr:hypothetical protein Pfra02_13660 [Pseudomonas fragi]